jgi:autotransporter-associated beta strand protein
MKSFDKICKIWFGGLFIALTPMVANHVVAQNLPPPVSGLQILDLAGTPIAANNVVNSHSASFVATSTASTVTFVFRHDPGVFTFDNASVKDSLAPATNLLTNGNFLGGATPPGGGSPGWTYFQQAGVTFLGHQLGGTGGWIDGATQGYDGIDQTFATLVGHTYDVAFNLSQNGANIPNYQQISTNGLPGIEGNGIDLLAYAGNGIPPRTVPELFWDGTVTVADGIIHGGTGTWNNTTTNWTDAAATVNAPWRNGFAVFEGTAGTVTLGDTIRTSGMQFMSDGYTIIAPGPQTLIGAPITTIRVDQGVIATISAPIVDGSSPAAITKTDLGTLILTGANTYTGGTTIAGGTLQLGDGGTTGSIVRNVTDSGILAFDRSNVLTFGGVISGTGSVQQNGAGTTVLLLDNSYHGGTIINAGTLQLGNGGTTGSITGNVTNNGMLAFDRSDAPTFAGVISGLGSVAQIGTGTTILTGTNTYTGGTAISAGTLQLGNGGTTGSITGNVEDNGTLTFDRSDAITFGGVISGTGDVVKLSTGTLTLTNASTYTGSTTVNSGSLIVDGSTMSAQTVVNSGAFLGGHGTIGGNLVNSGTVSQINSPGTLKVTGDYTQNPGGTLRIGVGGVATGQHDLLAVGGHATLGGTLQLISLGGFSLQPGEQITFLTANKGVSGTFNSAQNGLVNTGTIVLAQITTTSNSAVLVASQGSFLDTPGVATNSNNVAVAKALDSARGDPREAALFAFLNSQPVANLPHDLTLIAPTQVTSINATAVSVGKVQVSNVGARLADVHAGSTGFSSAGFSISGGAASIGEGFAGVSGPEGKSGPAVFAPTPDNRWGVFVTGLGEFSNVDSTPEAAGYDVNTGGVTFGVDYRLTPHFAIGLTGGYAHTSVGLDGGGNIDVNGGKLGLYATLFGNGFYLDTAATGGPSGYNTHRTALQGTASGSTDGADFNALIAVGYDWTKGNLSIGPTASFQYGYIGLNSFTETGSLAPLKFPDQNTESERSAFGAKASYQWKVSHVTVIPQVSAAWQHEYGDTAYSIVSSFASGAGKSFTVTGPDIGRDSILVGAGATVIWNERVSTYLYYDGEFARTNYLSNNVSGGVRISF